MANERIASLYHQLHSLVLADLHWQYGTRHELGAYVSSTAEAGTVIGTTYLEMKGEKPRSFEPSVTIAHLGAARFTINLACSCGFVRKGAKPGALCQHVWAVARDLSHRLEHRHWAGLGAVRELVGISADEEALAALEAVEREVTAAEGEARRRTPMAKEAPRRLVWLVDISNYAPLVPAVQTATRAGWGKAKPTRELAPLLALDLTDADRALLASMTGRSDHLLKSYGLWGRLAGLDHVIDQSGRAIEVTTGTASLRLEEEPEGFRLLCPELKGREGWDLLHGDDAVLAQGPGALLVLAATPGQAAALKRITRQPVIIPAQIAKAPRVHEIASRLGIAPPGAMDSREQPAHTEPTIFVERTGPTLNVEFQVQPLALGPTYAIGQGPPLVSLAQEGAWIHARRDPAAEHAAARALAERLHLATEDRVEYRWMLGAAKSLELIADLAETGLTPRWKGTPLAIHEVSSASLSLEIRRRTDWLELKGGLTVDGHTVELARVLQALKEKRGWVAVGHDRLLRLHDDLKRRLELLAAATDEAGEQASALAAPLVAEAIDGLAGPVQTDEAWRALAERLTTAGNVDTTLPAGLTATLRTYQHEGYAWLCRLAHWGAGAVLADDMGLGKTLQAIAIMLRRAAEGPILVVCPTSVESNWDDELARFAPGLVVRSLRQERDLPEPKPGEVVIVSYQMATRAVDRLKAITWGTLVLDEAQMVKNAAAKRSAALAELNAHWRLALTGAPVENRLSELWAIMALVTPGLLGTWEGFRDRFARPIEGSQDTDAGAKLRLRLAPFILRRTKEQVLTELPPKTEIVQHIEPSDAERKLIEAERSRALAELEAGAGKDAHGNQRIAILAALTRLRQLACAPQLLVEDSPVPSSKLTVLRELVQSLKDEGHQVLVFSQFTSLLNLIEDDWEDAGLTWLRLDGSTPQAERKNLVKRFQNGEADAFLLSLKAGGTGLNLTAASYVIHCDPWWNPATEDQASDRAHRMGQTKPVTIYRLVMKPSVEEKILALHQTKRDLIDAVLAGTDQAATLSEDDLMGLIRSAAG